MLLAHMNNRVRAIDTKTGKVKWKHDWEAHAWMSPAIITVDDTDILLCAQKKAFRLRDGKELTIKGGSDFGASTSVHTEKPHISFHTGNGEHCGWTGKGKGPPMSPTGVEWSLDGDTISGKVLWQGINGKAGGGHTGLTFHKGKLYHAYAALDPMTGKATAGALGDKKKGSFKSKHLLWGIGDRLYGLQKKWDKAMRSTPRAQQLHKAELICYSLDGKILGSSVLPAGKMTDAKRKQIIAQCGYKNWKEFSYSYPFTISNGAILLRGNDELWCIGK